VRGKTVCCSICGQPHPDHAVQKEIDAYKEPPPRKEQETVRMDYVATIFDRMKDMEAIAFNESWFELSTPRGVSGLKSNHSW
jgi:DNA repair exonuclease SbcCD ATPase subunit